MDNNRIEGAVRQVKGSIKEAVGKIAGNTHMQAEGRAEKVACEVQSKYGESKDTVRKTFK
ncbi:CsbD family protein [Agrobacterium cavarae]|uniref:CsbD family protein n=1 Tax=Agrobacterium cavarae TaxID=2528239 RepID=A0ABY1Y2I0_9HYPH|nr:CsbD family protein [Agrobacterium cavarae]TBN08308.1 CsbD family protein [Agrobacterium cavarae]